MKKHILGLGAVAGIMSVAIGSVNNFSNATCEIANKTKVRDAFAKRTASKPTEREIQKLAANRISDSKYFAPDYGIPPKIYGMYHVKRGTHKRTNI